MITTYLKENNSIVKNEEYIINESTLWIDLFNITDEEKVIIENTLNIEIPTLKDISQIEISERLYIENEALYLTITELVNKEQEFFPETHSIVFILYKCCLITIRYIELIPFNDCINKFAKQLNNKHNAENILFMLLRNMVTRLSNIVQSISIDIDDYGRLILDNNINGLRIDHTNVLKKIGRKGDLLSKSRECLF
ncbi:hypothetical protein FLA4_00200 [Candidatus Rickettsia kotlanii]|nr:hypothetical protein FLA4_00200 [Candidatus Rickettsia kotlanii]BDU60852.1 hypothetical protein HM2_00200 [Candidatus Rickettsia kotlanii]